jgi:hypothetical protein
VVIAELMDFSWNCRCGSSVPDKLSLSRRTTRPTECGSIVLAAFAGPRVPRGGVTRQGVVLSGDNEGAAS